VVLCTQVETREPSRSWLARVHYDLLSHVLPLLMNNLTRGAGHRHPTQPDEAFSPYCWQPVQNLKYQESVTLASTSQQLINCHSYSLSEPCVRTELKTARLIVCLEGICLFNLLLNPICINLTQIYITLILNMSRLPKYALNNYQKSQTLFKTENLTDTVLSRFMTSQCTVYLPVVGLSYM